MKRNQESRSHFALTCIRWGREVSSGLDGEAHPLLQAVLEDLKDAVEMEEVADGVRGSRLHSPSQSSPSRTRWLRSSNG